MAKTLTIRCPACGWVHSFNKGEDPFDPDLSIDFLMEREVGGKTKGKLGVGKGKAKPVSRTINSYDIDTLPKKYEYILDSLKRRINDTLTKIP